MEKGRGFGKDKGITKGFKWLGLFKLNNRIVNVV
jgi:hypothetical protein